MGRLHLVLEEERVLCGNFDFVLAYVRVCVHLADYPNEGEVIGVIILRRDGVWWSCKKRSTLSYI